MDNPPQFPDLEDPPSNNVVTDVEKPFDISAKADVILRSSDHINFYALKTILSLVSSPFDGIFSLDQGEGMKDEMKNRLPVVQLEEDGVTLYNLLQLIYPYDVEPSNIDVCVKVGRAAQKYAMDSVLQKLRRIVLVSEGVVKRPLSVFAIAATFSWVEVMKKAALNTLSISLCNLVVGQTQELDMLWTIDYHALLKWRFACQDALDELLTKWIQAAFSLWHWVEMAKQFRRSMTSGKTQSGNPT
jgi:hypothetical protein